MAIDFEALLQTFLAEARDNLERMEADLLALEREPDDRDRLHDVFRLAHTLKGDAASLGFPYLSRYAHRIEDFLEAVRSGKTHLSGESITMLLLAVDTLRGLLARAASGAEEERTEDAAGISRLARVASLDGLDVPGGPSIPGGAPPPPSGLQTVEPPGSAQTTGKWPIFAAPALPEAVAMRPTLRVAIERLDALVDRVGELGIARGRIANLLEREEVGKAEVLELHREHDRLHHALQDLVLELRMVPIGPVFRTLERTVRDLSAQRGKEVRLVYEGEQAEVDAGLAEHLRAPLAHMARNAVDHGIETPVKRRALGKDPTGTLTLSAFRDGNSLVIELADDGGGLDREKIVEKARAAGLLPDAKPEVADRQAPRRRAAAKGSRRSEEAHENTPEIAEMDEEEIDRLVLLPGFSTAERVDEASGRGVGLDVVRRTIESLRGRVDLISRTGLGTTIRLRLPLALGLLDGLTVAVGEETYIVPLEAVEEVIDRPAEGAAIGVVALRGEALSCVRLRDLLAVPGPEPEREQLLVISPRGERSGARLGLSVDALLGREQIVIRPLAPLFEGLPGLAGSTILGSGEVAFVLDLASLLRTGARGASGLAV